MRSSILTNKLLILSIIILTGVTSCKKGPGEGGRASIKGYVYTVNYNSSFTVPQDSGFLPAQKVYLIYGDDVIIGDDQDTNDEGAFEFKYLRKGKYKVYVLTKTYANHLDSAVVQEVDIAERKQTIELPVFRIKTSKN